MTLTEFLLARVAEDEAIARAASPGRWRIAKHDFERILDEQGDWVADSMVGTVDHIAHHDPARVLAECAAKRQVIDIHSSPFDAIAEAAEQRGSAWEWFTDDERTLTRPQYLVSRGALRVLALPYADHPDYRDEWRMS